MSQQLASKTPVLGWGIPALGEGWEEALALIRELAALEQAKAAAAATPIAKPLAEQLEEWLAARPGEFIKPAEIVKSLAWANALPWLIERLEPAVWQTCLQKLLQQAETATKSRNLPLLTRQFVAAELPQTLAYWFPELEACQWLADAGVEAALASLEAAVDAAGVIHGKYLPWLRPLLASWIRMAALEHELPKDRRTLAAQAPFQRLIGQALRLTREDGSQVLSPPGAAVESRESITSMFRAALRYAGEPERRLAALAMPQAAAKSKRPAGCKRKAAGKAPAAAFNSEISQLAVLRTGWASWEERLTVAYHDRRIAAELICGRETVCCGAWNPEIEFNGALLQADSEWQEVCWVSDDDVDYLELELSLSGGVRVQRHLLLARQDHFLFAADAVLGESRGTIDYRASLPLARGVQFAPANESNEGHFVGRRRFGLIMPLALAEWRSEASPGSLRTEGGALELRQTATNAAALFAPLFIDLAPRRFSRPFTWRRLTIAENQQIVPSESAVGYRVQVGGQQWLFYRSLGPRGNRTLLGHNLVTEFLAARFNRDGVAESLLEIE
ncbi:MAG TPA: hypothetical protein VMV10_07750 [Pirellulales bacterium]|nr:hypothetical protein [Pirellulales bacterium]